MPKELASGDEDEEGGDGAAPTVHLLMKDAQEIRAVLGLALTKCGRFAEAADVWSQAAQITARSCPPFDEALCAYALQAALCSAASGNSSAAEAEQRLRTAASLHRMSFGGGAAVGFFKKRYAKEVALTAGLTPGTNAKDRQQRLFESLDGYQVPSVSWADVQEDICRWRTAASATAPERKKRARIEPGSKGKAPAVAKPKAVVVNGMRILP